MAHLVFVHGIANKPCVEDLLRNWLRILAREEGQDSGVKLSVRGITSSMVYWADVMYPEPEPDNSAHESAVADAPQGLPQTEDTDWRGNTSGESEEAWLRTFQEGYGIDPDEPFADQPTSELQNLHERIPLPWVLKRPFLKLLVRDTHHYLFNQLYSPRPEVSFKVRDEIRSRFVSELQAASSTGDPLIVVAHSQGTVVTYDCLKNVPECPAIDGLITLGSPLGLDEVQDKLEPGYSRENGFPSDKLQGDWINIYDPLDVVSRADPKLSGDYQNLGRGVIMDRVQTNSGAWRHSMTKYLSGTEVRHAIRSMFGLPQ